MRGDKVTLVAPAYTLRPEQVESSVQLVESLGLVAHVPADVLGDDLLCAHDDAHRLAHLQAAFADAQSKAVWAMRGGYGVTRLMPKLLAMKVPEHRQWLLGFSDITALHLLVNQQWGWPSVHAPVTAQWADDRLDEATVEGLRRLLVEGGHSMPVTEPMNKAAARMDAPKADDRIVGGNLCLLQASLGTAWQVQAKDAWLLLEEVDERGYRIDRMLTHLRQAGALTGVRGVLLGDMNGGDEPNGGNMIGAVLERFAGEAAVPVFRLRGVGHTCTNLPLVLGMPAA
jgi:muramoyltetrapeptide carboxypeptidase